LVEQRRRVEDVEDIHDLEHTCNNSILYRGTHYSTSVDAAANNIGYL